MEYRHIKLNTDKKVTTITMSRPEVHNAFNDQMIHELTFAFQSLKASTQVVVLTGEGRSFSAGADLNWMKSMLTYSKKENMDDSLKLAELFNVINNCPLPVIGKINGHALGGGIGLVSVCDFAITHPKAKFGLTEVKLGLIPAVISPFVIHKIGESHARSLFLSGEKFSAKHAYHIGLIHRMAKEEDFEAEFDQLLNEFTNAGPNAQKAAKKLINDVLAQHHLTKQQMAAFTAEAIATRRISTEGQEGMTALLEKREPHWNKK